ncbi:MAG TPA: EscU/YscU/HrcU family type III secretion system export apparatus switch protein, partial [Candidatus Acidoferrales bacterium]|nr:EscU/YscU/HrcU family type III secretion system export apparatus switch protein [Candidatus Acidoferrales bacterium]
MSEAGEKPFDATPQRLERARREGNVARAGELAANGAFAAAALALAALLPALQGYARVAIERAARGTAPLAETAALLACCLAAPAAGAVAAVAVNAFQSGGIRFAPVSLKGERLDPVEGCKRMLSRDSLLHAVRAAVAFTLAAAVMFPVLVQAAAMSLGALDARSVAAAAWSACERVAAIACATGLVFAAGEFASARSAWLKKLRMSFEERKREAKDQEGDPHARGRRRSLHRSLLRGAIARVREAAFVIANPTHLAIALEYRPPEVSVPRVLVRAAGAAALRVRELAAEFDIPVVENVALARVLFRAARPGEAIPHAQYVAVAEVVAAL